MRSTVAAGLLALLGFAAGCSQEPAAQPQATPPATALTTSSTTSAAPTTTTTTTSSVPPTPKIIQKKIGDLAGIGPNCTATGDTCELTYRITKITGCTGKGYAGDAPDAGTTRKLIWVEISTSASYDVAQTRSGLVTQFRAINAAGVTSGGINPSLRWKCTQEKDQLGFGDENWLPSKKYAGAIEVYLPNDAVKITNGDGNWEWSLI